MNAFTRRLFKLPDPPLSPSPHHSDLPSFLSYAHRTALPPTSTTYIGTHYEYTVQQTLRRFAFSLHRTGGRSDAGIDLLGTWHLPQHEHPLRTIVQCKSLKTKLGPNLVRELEGTFKFPSRTDGETGGTLGVLVSPREATRGVREALARSAYPLLWMMVERGGVLQQALWNARVEEMGLGSLGVEVRYGNGNGGEEEVKKSVALTWDGEEVPGMDRVEEDLARAQDEWLGLWEESGRDPEAVLEVVERLFPHEKPLLLGRERSALTREEREEVKRLLREKSIDQ